MRVGAHQRVVAEARIQQGVGHDEQVGLVDGVGAERDVARRLRHVHPDPRLEPLAVAVDEADERHRGAADLGRQQREIVEALLRFGVEDPVATQRRQTVCLTRAHRCPPGMPPLTVSQKPGFWPDGLFRWCETPVQNLTANCDKSVGHRPLRVHSSGQYRQPAFQLHQEAELSGDTRRRQIGDPAVHDEEEGEGRFRKRRGVPVRRGFLSRIGVWLLGAVIMGIVPLAVSLWVRALVADYVPMLNAGHCGCCRRQYGRRRGLVQPGAVPGVLLLLENGAERWSCRRRPNHRTAAVPDYLRARAAGAGPGGRLPDVVARDPAVAGHRLDAPAVTGPGGAPGGPSDSGRGGGRDARGWPSRAGAVRVAGGTQRAGAPGHGQSRGC